MMQNVHQQMQQLGVSVRSLNDLMARNDMLAARHPMFAAKLANARRANAGLYQDADLKVRQAYADYAAQGMGSGALIAGGVAAVVGIAAVGAVSILYYIEQREQREFVAENPMAAAFQSASRGVWAILGIGVLALGGLVYWDYRKGQEARPYSTGGGRPFDDVRRDAKALARDARSLRGSGKPRSTKKAKVSPDTMETIVAERDAADEALEQFHREVEAEQQRTARRPF